MADACIYFMNKKIKHDLINIGTGKATTISELANMIIDISGLDLKPVFKDSLDGDIKESQADNNLAVKSFNWTPKKDLREWLTEIL